jgi:hypothetical protein
MVRKERTYGLSKEGTFHISRNKLCAWMWKPKEKLDEEEKSSLDKCFELYQSLKTLYNTVQTYRNAIQMGDIDTLYNDLECNYPPRKIPFTIMHLDFEVIFRLLNMHYLCPTVIRLFEGQINRLKTIKWLTYGRAGLVILEKRVLYRL